MPVYKNYTIQKRMWVLIFYDGNAILFTPSKRVWHQFNDFTDFQVYLSVIRVTVRKDRDGKGP